MMSVLLPSHFPTMMISVGNHTPDVTITFTKLDDTSTSESTIEPKSSSTLEHTSTELMPSFSSCVCISIQPQPSQSLAQPQPQTPIQSSPQEDDDDTDSTQSVDEDEDEEEEEGEGEGEEGEEVSEDEYTDEESEDEAGCDDDVDSDNEPHESEDDEDDSTPQHDSSTPFWFAYEDPDQIEKIIDSYTRYLRLDKERMNCIRAPVPFVGCVKRTVVQDEDLPAFTTLDEVSIFKREICPLGEALPLDRTAYLLTTWDNNDGIPSRYFDIKDDKIKKLWRAKSMDSAASYLFCQPVMHTKSDYLYSVDSDRKDISYSPGVAGVAAGGGTPKHFYCYSAYLPRHRISEDDEDEEYQPQQPSSPNGAGLRHSTSGGSFNVNICSKGGLFSVTSVLSLSTR